MDRRVAEKEEALALCRDVDVGQIRLSRGEPLCSAKLGARNAPILVSGLPLMQLVSPVGDGEALMRCAFGASSKFKSTKINLCVDDAEAVAFFDRLDVHIKRELLRPEISDLTEEQIEAAYNPIYKRYDDASLPGNVGLKMDPWGFQPTEVYPIVAWGEDGVLRHRAMVSTRMSTEEKMALFQKDSQVVSAVARFSSVSLVIDKDTGGLKIYPGLNLVRVAVYLPEENGGEGEDDPFA